MPMSQEEFKVLTELEGNTFSEDGSETWPPENWEYMADYVIQKKNEKLILLKWDDDIERWMPSDDIVTPEQWESGG